MKRRIEQLLNGKFEYRTAALRMLPEELSIQVKPGETAQGSFVLESQDGRKIRGFLYSSNPRVACDPAEFQGVRNEIRYQADGNGLGEGTEEEGFLTVLCELGEYRLPYRLCIGKKKPAGEGKLPFGSLQEFGILCEKEFQSAYRLFLTGEFRAFLKEQAPELTALYDGLSRPSFSYQSLEEFLIGAHLKDPVEISVGQVEFSLAGLSEPVAETLEITRHGWGFQKIILESDGCFLRPEKEILTTDEFAGSTCALRLVVDTNRMHAGKNFARLTLKTSHQRICVTVVAQADRPRQGARQSHILKIMQKKLEGLYVGFRLQKTDLSTWVERSVSVINSYRRAGGTDPFAELFLAQLYFADGKRQKAIRTLESLEEHRERLDTPERFGFYLYMTTFFRQEVSYVDQVETEIRSLYARNRASWVLRWILLYLQESYLKNPHSRYEAVAEQFECGCRSRILYLEAYQVLKEDPVMMRHLGSFELQILRFARREQVLTAEILRQVSSLADHYGKYSAELYEILCAGYQTYPADDLVRSLCLLLMRGERKDPEAFAWYERGVACGLRITGLYEFYMESSPETVLARMPQIIRMYFAYDHSLDYRRRAAVYWEIVRNQEADPQTYRNYRPAMERFAAEQLEMGRFTAELGELYRVFLHRDTMTVQMAEQMLRILFTWEVDCAFPGFRSITVSSGCLVGEQAAILLGGRARIQIYDPDSMVLLEDREGNRCTSGPLCGRTKLYDNADLLEWCAGLAPNFPGLVLFICAGSLKEGILNRRTLPYLRTGCEMAEFQPEFRCLLRRRVLGYYLEHPREDSLPDFLEHISYQDYVEADKAALITLLAEEGMCTDAFSLLDVYGAEGIPLLKLVRICSRMVLELEFGENPMLVSLCHFCFASGKYDDKLLRYLLLYYEGPIQDMKELWDAARKFGLDTMLLEEKLLMMALFTGSGTEGTEPIFASYRKKLGRRKICRAYVNLKAYEYFVKGLPVGEPVFLEIEGEYRRRRGQGRLSEQEEVCRLALLQYYSCQVELTADRRQIAAELLEEFGAKGMRFAFWNRFDRELLAPHQMEGRVFAEYAGDPAASVTIHYRRKGCGEDFRAEPMKNCFGGIFVKEYTLFSGDELECFLTEELGEEKRRLDDRTLRLEHREQEEMTRYALLDEISASAQAGEGEKLYGELDNYLLLGYLSRELFTLV